MYSSQVETIPSSPGSLSSSASTSTTTTTTTTSSTTSSSPPPTTIPFILLPAAAAAAAASSPSPIPASTKAQLTTSTTTTTIYQQSSPPAHHSTHQQRSQLTTSPSLKRSLASAGGAGASSPLSSAAANQDLLHRQQSHSQQQHTLTTFDFPSTPQSSSSRASSPPSANAPNPPPPARPRRQSQKPYPALSSSASGAASASATSPPAAPDAANQLEAKVVILGSQGVGKTSIVHRYTSGHFSYSLTSTIGASFLTKRLVVDGCKVRLQLWDTAGQERFRSMAPLYYRGALAAILVYDITNLESFYDIKNWLDELRRNMSPDLIIHVVGSKVDLAPTLRAVDLEFARRSVAEWMYEFEVGTLPTPPSRDSSPPSPTRSRTRTMSTRGVAGSAGVIGGGVTPLSFTGTGGAGGPGTGSSSSSGGPPGGLPSSVSMPSITTTRPDVSGGAGPSIGARVRKMSTKLGGGVGGGIGGGSSSSGGGGSQGSSALLSASGIGGPGTGIGGGVAGGSGSSASSISEASAVLGAVAGGSEGMVRSGSKLGLALGLGMSTSRGRKSHEEERKSQEELERERLDELVREYGIEVSEVSGKDDFGIEDLFLDITRRLVERKAQIESDRVLRSRDSIMINENDSATASSGGYCC